MERNKGRDNEWEWPNYWQQTRNDPPIVWPELDEGIKGGDYGRQDEAGDADADDDADDDADADYNGIIIWRTSNDITFCLLLFGMWCNLKWMKIMVQVVMVWWCSGNIGKMAVTTEGWLLNMIFVTDHSYAA